MVHVCFQCFTQKSGLIYKLFFGQCSKLPELLTHKVERKYLSKQVFLDVFSFSIIFSVSVLRIQVFHPD